MPVNDLPRHTHNGNDSPRVNYDNLENLPGVFEDLSDAPLAKVDAPSGGSTIDSEARTAINAVITRLEDLGLINEN